MSICYDYLRPRKAEAVKKWYNKEFIKKESLEASSYSEATILPLKSLANDNLLFGRGGVVEENGKYIEDHITFCITYKIKYVYLQSKS